MSMSIALHTVAASRSIVSRSASEGAEPAGAMDASMARRCRRSISESIRDSRSVSGSKSKKIVTIARSSQPTHAAAKFAEAR